MFVWYCAYTFHGLILDTLENSINHVAKYIMRCLFRVHHTHKDRILMVMLVTVLNVHEMWMLKMMMPVAKKIAAIQYKDGYFYFLIQAATKFYREKKTSLCLFFWMKLNVCLICFIFDDHHRRRLHCIANNEQFYLWSEKKYARFLGVQLYNNSWTMMMMEQISIKWNVYDFPSTSSSC